MTSILKQRSFWFGFLLITTSAFILFLTQSGLLERPGTVRELPVYGQIAEFQLTERSGKTVSAADLKGKTWIANFIFTRCAGICPMMSNKMQRVQSRLQDRPDVRLVSFSVDPEHDTPQVLAEYAKRFQADPEKWLFLTGDKPQIFKLSQQHFYLAVADIPEAERPAEDPTQTVAHSSKFVLVDSRGQIRGYYASEDEDYLDRLLADMKRLEK